MNKVTRILHYIILYFILLAIACPTLAQDLSVDESESEKIEKLSEEIEALNELIESQSEVISRIKISGVNRIRFKNTLHSETYLPLGTYGEVLKKGRKLNHRMTLELETQISDNLFAGGMLRLSNEDSIIFETGPERLSSERGSIFIKSNFQNLQTTFGYYDISLTPLTLMRWDIEDNPEGGGESSCTCISEGGAYTSESLEELGPNLTFEGCKVNGIIGDHIDTVALFARPRIAKTGKSYEQYLYGANVKFLFYHKDSNSFRWLGITAISIEDDKTSISSPPTSYDLLKNRVFSGNFNLPLGKIFLVNGEFVKTTLPLKEKSDYAMILSISARFAEKLLIKPAYLRMNPDYKSLYNSISYTSNRQGFRLSSRYDIVKDKTSVWVFYKHLSELKSIIKKEPELLKTFTTASLGTSVSLIKNWTANFSYIMELTQRDKGIELEEVNEIRHSGIIDIIYKFNHNNRISLRFQHLRFQDKFNKDLNYHVNITSILAESKF